MRVARDAGAKAGVYRTLLTHFSQRYPKVPVFDDSYSARTAIAFDLMTVKLTHLQLLPHLIAPLKVLFKDELPDDDLE